MRRSACRYIEKGKQLNQKIMAKVTDVFVSGSLGNIIFYRRMGTQCARSRALHVKQSAATKTRSANFGIAARAGKTLRSGLMSLYRMQQTEACKAGFPVPYPNGSAFNDSELMGEDTGQGRKEMKKYCDFSFWQYAAGGNTGQRGGNGGFLHDHSGDHFVVSLPISFPNFSYSISLGSQSSMLF